MTLWASTKINIFLCTIFSFEFFGWSLKNLRNIEFLAEKWPWVYLNVGFFWALSFLKTVQQKAWLTSVGAVIVGARTFPFPLGIYVLEVMTSFLSLPITGSSGRNVAFGSILTRHTLKSEENTIRLLYILIIIRTRSLFDTVYPIPAGSSLVFGSSGRQSYLAKI